MKRPRATIAIAIATTCLALQARPVSAIPPPEPPRAAATIEPTPAPAGSTLPVGSTLLFVLDDKIDSGSTKPGTVVHLHLKSALVIDGTTVAPAGAPATLAIVTTQGAHSGDIDGAVQVHLNPLALKDGVELPIRAAREYLNVERSGGQLATRDTTDTLGDIFIPGHVLYHAFRRGRQYVAPVGSVVRARTAATVTVRPGGAVALETPPPFVSTYDVPHADLTAAPFYTPQPARPKPLPKGKPTLPPTPAPSAGPPTSEPTR